MTDTVTADPGAADADAPGTGRPGPRTPRQRRDQRRRTLATTLGVGVGVLAFGLTLLDWSTRLGRTANPLGYASNFFDVQGRALLDGRLDVPPGSLGIEGFLEDGREYTYFPLWPAILRLPVLATTTSYDGRLTVASMALGFAVLAVMTVRLTWLVRELLLGDRPVSRTETAMVAVFLAAATGGTTVTYLAALPWVYHEVYTWSVAFVVAAMYWMLRVLRDPSRHATAWLFVCALGAIMTRTTGGWAVCLGTAAVGAWALTGRIRPSRREGAWLVAAGLVALLAGIALNWAKFRHPYLFPLEDQVWTAVNEHRREALDANGGTITGLQFFTTAFMAYFRLDGARLVDHFPFVTLPAEPAQAYGGAFVDQSYRTGSVTAFMPMLLVLALLSVVVLFRPRVREELRWLRAPLLTGVLMTGGVMAYGYFSHRYTAEFVPALVLGGAVGTFAVVRGLHRLPRPPRAVVVAVAGGAAAWSVVASMLVGHAAAAYTAGGDSLGAYVETQLRLTPGAQRDLVTFGDGPPHGGRADDLWVQGDCDALYLNSGDAYDEWLLVERRSVVVDATVAPDAAPGRVRLVVVTSPSRPSVWLQNDGRGRARVQIVNETGTFTGAWFDLLPPGRVRIGVKDLPGLGYAEVSANPGGFVGLVRSFVWDDDWVSQPVDVEPAFDAEVRAEQAERGVTLDEGRGLDPSTCTRVRDAALDG